MSEIIEEDYMETELERLERLKNESNK